MAAAIQGELFADPAALPEGFRHQPGLISEDEANALVRGLEGLAFRPFEFQGRLALREVVGFGWRYDYSRRQVLAAEPIPDFLLSLRKTAAAFAGRPPEAFEQVLINAYRPGAGIGWHRDKPQFGEVVGVSLLAPCTLRFRRRAATGWQRRSLQVCPRSAYLMSGPARHAWEHSIPPVSARRYSITLRTLAAGRPS